LNNAENMSAAQKFQPTNSQILGFRYRASFIEYKIKVSNRCNQIYISIVYVTSHPDLTYQVLPLIILFIINIGAKWWHKQAAQDTPDDGPVRAQNM
jgi:hypothetical protein